MEHHVWDTVSYHGHPCIVECEWNEITGMHEHWLMLHPTDGGHGSYIISEDQLTADGLLTVVPAVNNLQRAAAIMN